MDLCNALSFKMFLIEFNLMNLNSDHEKSVKYAWFNIFIKFIYCIFKNNNNYSIIQFFLKKILNVLSQFNIFYEIVSSKDIQWKFQ